jgi:hypothetical protein
MRAIMWNELETDLVPSSTRTMSALLHPQSGITPYIRELYVLHAADVEDGEDPLRLLLAALPRDKLRCFQSNPTLLTTTFQLLLQSKRRLEDIDTWTTLTAPGRSEKTHFDSADHRSWMTSSMSEVSTLTLYIEPEGDQSEQACDEMESLVRCCPKLTELILAARFSNDYEEHSLNLILSYAKTPSLFSNITRLRLHDVDVQPDNSVEFLNIFNWHKLQELQLTNCDYMVPLLKSLSSFYTQPGGDLKAFQLDLILDIENPEETIKAAETLLRVCPKLEELELDFFRHCVIDVNCIAAHSDTLCSLVVGTSKSGSKLHFPVTDMKVMLKACTKLKWLGTNLPPLNLGSVEKLGADLRLDGTDTASVEFENMLVSSTVNHHDKIL